MNQEMCRAFYILYLSESSHNPNIRFPFIDIETPRWNDLPKVTSQENRQRTRGHETSQTSGFESISDLVA